MPGKARLPEHSVTPCLVSGVRNMASGRKRAAQDADEAVPIRFTDAVTRQCGDAARMLAVASRPSAEPEILRPVTGELGQSESRKASAAGEQACRDHS